MSIFAPERSYDYTKEHKILDHDDTHIFCPHCGKTIEDRPMPDYGMFMSGVWIKQNLPCKPYENPEAPEAGSPTDSQANTRSGES